MRQISSLMHPRICATPRKKTRKAGMNHWNYKAATTLKSTQCVCVCVFAPCNEVEIKTAQTNKLTD